MFFLFYNMKIFVLLSMRSFKTGKNASHDIYDEFWTQKSLGFDGSVSLLHGTRNFPQFLRRN